MREKFIFITRQRVTAVNSPLIRPAATFSLRAKSRLRRLRSDTRLRAQPQGGRLYNGCSPFRVIHSQQAHELLQHIVAVKVDFQ